MEFDRWQQWGALLDDADFARAFAALGVVAGSAAKQEAIKGFPGVLLQDPKWASPDILLTTARIALHDALAAPLPRGTGIRWRFPRADDAIDADGRFLLTRIEAATWARAWSEALALAKAPPRLRLTDAPEGEPVAPWFRWLAQADPAPAAASLVLEAPQASLAVQWPLRFGALPGSAGEPILANLTGYWPSSRLVRAYAVDRDNANCDVLVHIGDGGSLLRALLALPFRCKCNLILLVGPVEADALVLSSRLQALVNETCASGVLLQDRPADDHSLVMGWNQCVTVFSHDEPLDRALHLGLREQGGIPGIPWLTDALADLHLARLAEGLTAGVRALPAGTRMDLSRMGPGLASGWVGTARAAGHAGAILESLDPARADPGTLRFDTSALHFDRESHGASEVASLAEAVAGARLPPEAETRRAARFLQQRTFTQRAAIWEEARHGLVLGRPVRLRVRIGPPEESWQSLATQFPEERLPPRPQQWRLTLWLTEPRQLSEPLRGTLKLPPEGPSSECELQFRPQALGPFEGRLTVLHRGRVLQTAVLRAGVVAEDASLDAKHAPRLGDLIPVRHRIGDLEGRRQFDLAFVTNHTSGEEPRGVALSADRAWIADVAKGMEIAKDINTALSRVAKSVADYAEGIAGEAGRKLLVDLAKKGAWLDLYLVRGQLRRAGNRPDVAEKEYIQIVSTRSDALVPFELIYDQEVPDDDAGPCPRWREGLAQGSCAPGCAGGTAKAVCPFGFWGLRKVIERHQVSPEHATAGRELFLQSEPGRLSSTLSLGGTALFASSNRVPAEARAAVEQALGARLGTPPRTAASWADWATIVGEARPHFLVALTHTDGVGANVSLEINGNSLSTIQVKEAHLCGPGEESHPLVALLGCDTLGTANDYGEHVVVFRDRGAAVVIGTIATVFGEHAARVAVLLTEALVPNGAPPQRLGEAIRALKRRALLEGLLMPLCLVAYGDADWNLVR